jgi:hypothetical protein
MGTHLKSTPTTSIINTSGLKSSSRDLHYHLSNLSAIVATRSSTTLLKKSKSKLQTIVPSLTHTNGSLRYIGNFCKDHADLKASFDDVKLLEPGFTFEFNFKKGDGNCAFDCITLFSAFVESDSCITGTGMQKNGVVKTECGSASYLGYNLV